MLAEENGIEQPLATVNICTRNRSQSLKRTLDSIVAAAKHVTAPWELQIIDNGSTDDTAEIVSSYGYILPIRRIEAPVPGLSNARNVGVKHARGKFIIWTDDDVRVAGDWLQAYLEVFENDQGFDLFGGKATPFYEEPKVQWFIDSERYLSSLLAIRNEPGWTEVNAQQMPWGLNYAVRTSVQRRHLYDPNLGVAPGRRRGGEESAMIRSAISGGSRGTWVWGAEVYHLIPAHRQTARYIWEYYFAAGQDVPVTAMFGQDVAATPARLLGLTAKAAVKSGLLLSVRDARWAHYFAALAQGCGNLRSLLTNSSNWNAA